MVMSVFWDREALICRDARTGTRTEQITAAAHATWAVLQRKWRTVSGGLDLILDETHPLGFWRKVMFELHGIDLPQRH